MVVAAATGTLALLGAGGGWCGPKYGPGVTDNEILIGQTMPYSGPLSAQGVMTGKAMQAYFDKVNDDGGINGRKIRLLSLDDGYAPPKTVEQTRKLVEQDEVLLIFGTLGTPTNLAIRKYLNARKVPQLFITTGVTKFGDQQGFPWTMGWLPNFSIEAAGYAAYLLKHRPSARIGVLYQNDDYGRDLLAGLKQALGDKAQRLIVAEASYEVADPTVDQQIIALQGAGADTLMNFSTPKAAAQAIRKAYDIGWRPLHFLSTPATSIDVTLKPAGLEKSIGLLSATYYKDPGDPQWTDDPGVRAYLAFMKKYYPEAEPGERNTIIGYLEAMTLVAVLKQCGNELTRENVMRQAANIKHLELPLLLPGTMLNTTATDYYPIEQLQLIRFDGMRWVRFGEVFGR
jgi:ABC-type branched-subunit amino acid transport system substrate-binding protein